LVLKWESIRQILRWTQGALFGVAALMLCYCAFVVADSWVFQARADRALELRLQDESPAFRAVVNRRAPAPSAAAAPIGPDGLIGRLEIRRLGVSIVVFEGIAHRTLRHAVGHVEATALPGQVGNVGIAGHRDTFFRPLKDIVPDDIIALTTPAGEYRYRVAWTKVVGPYDVAVLDSTGNEVLTLVTCYPFYFVGSAPDRFIVRAERVL
jgi:sortase A